MKFREAKKLKEDDLIVELSTDIIYLVTSIEVFVDAKQVRIYASQLFNSNHTAIFYNNEIEYVANSRS